MTKVTIQSVLNNGRFVRCYCNSTASASSQINGVVPSQIKVKESSSSDNGFSKQCRLNDSIHIIRKEIAPWISMGYQKGLLSHLTTGDIIRALFVLRLCSYDFIVSQSLQLFELSRKFGPFGEWMLRKTFFNQFVGGDTIVRMGNAVGVLQQRELILMVAPVLEEDVEDEKSLKKTYDDNLNTLLNLAEMTSALERNAPPIIQLKLTAIMPATTLEKVSRAIESKMMRNNEIPANIILSIANCVENPTDLDLKLDSEDLIHFIDGLKRADEFVKKARDSKVLVIVDAEFFSCKHGISSIALALMARYNLFGSVVGNTIQGYLKEAVSTIENELYLTTKEIGVNWYGKIVRGAYMDKENILARKFGYPSPICDSYDATNSSYNACVRKTLENIVMNPNGFSQLLVATHNETSIRFAAQTMKELNIAPNKGRVSFAQIYGMADYLSTPLVKMGYNVYKSTPYGPINKVMPYLARRASENRSVMQGAREEQMMLMEELKHRLKIIN